MTMHTATEQLWRAAHHLRDDVRTLRLQAVEDHPRYEPNKLIDKVGTAADTMAGWAEEILDSAARARSGDRRELDAVTGAVERLSAVLHEELTASTRLDELNAMGGRGGPELRAWVGAIKHALDRVHPSLLAVQIAVITCWREVAERTAPLPASAHEDTARRT